MPMPDIRTNEEVLDELRFAERCLLTAEFARDPLGDVATRRDEARAAVLERMVDPASDEAMFRTAFKAAKARGERIEREVAERQARLRDALRAPLKAFRL